MSAPKKIDRNSELMKLAGSKTGAYDPEAPAQWRYVLEHGTPAEQVVAWVKSKTTHMSRSPFAASERGTPLWVKHVATDLGWTAKFASNVLNIVAAQGRIRLDPEAERIWYCADFDIPAAPKKLQNEVDDLEFVQIHLPSYIVDFIATLPIAISVTRARQGRALVKWKEAVLKDGMAALRAIVDEKENTTFEGWGAKKKRYETKPKPRAVPLQISLAFSPDFVHNPDPQLEDDVVQETIPTLHKSQKRSVQVDPSLSVTDSDSDVGAARARSSEKGTVSVRQSEVTDRPKAPSSDAANAEREVAELLVAELAAKLPGEAPGPALCARVLTALRGAPLENLGARIRHRLKRFTSMGMAEDLAREVGDAWAAGAADRQRALVNRFSIASWTDPQTRKEALDVLADSDASPELRTLARQILAFKEEKSKGAGS